MYGTGNTIRMTSKVSDSLIDKDIESVLADVAKAENLREYRLEKADGSVKGDGYVGVISCIKIIGKNKENEYAVLDVVVKSASRSDALRSAIPVECMFIKEIHMYNNVFSTFHQFEIEKGLQPSYFAPKFYKGNLTKKSEAVVLENLKESGYRLHERKIAMNDEHVSLVMAQYGRMHALSLALRDQNPQTFEKHVGCLEDMYVKFLNEIFFGSIKHRCTKILESLDTNMHQKAITKLQKLIDGLQLFLGDLGESVDEYSVALHGDCWMNNLLFNYKDLNNPAKPTQVRFIDYQLSKLGPPVLDLSYFIYACSSKEVINNLDYYMRVYYNSLSSHLQNLGSDPEKLLPYSVLQQQWKKFGKFGFIVSTITIHSTLSEKEEIVDLKDISEKGEDVGVAFSYEISDVERYNSRVIPIVLHLSENDFI